MNFLGKFRAWRKRKRQKRLERWERTRAKGKTRFVVRVSLIWIGVMVPVNILNDYLFDGRFRLSTVIYYIASAPILGLVGWWIAEGEYRAAKIDARMKAFRKQ